MCCIDMAADIVCRICGDGRYNIAQSISRLQYSEYDHFQFIGIAGDRFTYPNHVFGSGQFICFCHSLIYFFWISFCRIREIIIWNDNNQQKKRSNVYYRERFRRVMPLKRSSSSSVSKKGKFSSNARNVVVSNRNEPIIVRCVNDAFEKWIITVHGNQTEKHPSI